MRSSSSINAVLCRIGGQVGDTVTLASQEGPYSSRCRYRQAVVRVSRARRTFGKRHIGVGDLLEAAIDVQRRQAVVLNHSATHACCMQRFDRYWVRMSRRRGRWLLPIACASTFAFRPITPMTLPSSKAWSCADPAKLGR